MLSDKIKNRIVESVKAENNLVDAKKKKEDSELIRKIKKVEKIISKIKANTQLLAESKMKLEMDSKGNHVYVANMKQIFSSNIPISSYIYSQYTEIDFINFFSKDVNFPLSSQIEDLKAWMDSEGIESIIIKYEHDGFGESSWNSYWLKLKD